MKAVLGVVLAGALAGGAAVFFGPPAANRLPPTDLASPPAGEPVKGPPKYEHLAFCNLTGYYDGPGVEAMAGPARAHQVDAGGNVYCINCDTQGALRCVRAGGMVETVVGDRFWTGSLALDEGPACWLPSLSFAGGIGQPASQFIVRGEPLLGEDKGWIYVWTGDAKGQQSDGRVFKVFKNKAKNDRWWFKRVPVQLGERDNIGVHGDGSLVMINSGSVYRYDEAAQKRGECILNLTDYQDKVKHPKDGHPLGAAEKIVCAVGGTFFLGYYNKTYSIGQLYRVSADRKQVEVVAQDAGNKNHMDGAGLKTGWFGGPLLFGYTAESPSCAYLGAIDDAWVRRWKDGRVACLCKDGEWREFPTEKSTANGEMKSYAAFKDTEPPLWGRGYIFGPKGSHAFYQCYQSRVEGRIIKVSPVDFDKKTVGPLVGGE